MKSKMYKPLKEALTMEDCENMMADKKSKCDVCGRIFRSAHGASGICPKCQEEFEPDEMEFIDIDGNIHYRKFPRL